MSATLPIDPLMGNPRPMGGASPSPQTGLFNLRSKDGQVVPIRANTVEDAFDILDEMEANGLVPKSAANRFVHGVADTLNPVTMLKGIGSAIAHPINTAQALVDAQSERAIKAYDLAKEGRYSEAAGNAGAAVLPVLGPVAADIGEQAGSGDIAGAAGRLTGLAVLPRVAGNVAKAVPGAARVASSASKEALAIAKDAGGVKMRLMSPTIAEGVAVKAGSMVGGAPGATIAYGLMKVPSVWKAVRDGIAKRKGISGAQAEAAALKMAPEELVAEVAKIPQEKLPAGFTMDAKSAGGPPVTAEQLAAAPSDIESLGFKLKPIPPSKSPVRPPDPEVPEMKMRDTAAAKETAKAPQSVSDEAVARAARQKEHIAESYRQKAAKDAKNLAAEDDLEAQLKASLKPKAPPAEAKSIADQIQERVLSMKKQGMSRGQMKSSILEDILRRKDGYKPADVERAVDLILKETK